MRVCRGDARARERNVVEEERRAEGLLRVCFIRDLLLPLPSSHLLCVLSVLLPALFRPCTTQKKKQNTTNTSPCFSISIYPNLLFTDFHVLSLLCSVSSSVTSGEKISNTPTQQPPKANQQIPAAAPPTCRGGSLPRLLLSLCMYARIRVCVCVCVSLKVRGRERLRWLRGR